MGRKQKNVKKFIVADLKDSLESIKINKPKRLSKKSRVSKNKLTKAHIDRFISNNNSEVKEDPLGYIAITTKYISK